MNHVKQRLQKQRMNPKSREYQLAQMHTPKKINSGVGWFVVDILWWLVLIMMFVVLISLMTSWLIVGPWRLLKYIIRLFKK